MMPIIGASKKELFVSVHIATEMQKACFLCEQRAGAERRGRKKSFDLNENVTF